MVDAASALPGRERAIDVPALHEVLGTPLRVRPSPRASSRPCSGWAASGARRGSSGRRPASTPPPSATRAGSRRTRPTRRSARDAPGHTEAVLVVFDPAATSYEAAAEAVLGGPRSDAGDAPGQRRRQPVPLGDLLGKRVPTRRGRSLARCLPAGAERRGPRRDHDRDRRRAIPSTPSTTPRTTTSSTWRRTPAAMRRGRDRRQLPRRPDAQLLTHS